MYKWTIRITTAGLTLLALLSLMILLGTSYSPVTKRIIGKETGSTRSGRVTHYLIADDGSRIIVSSGQFYRTAVGDSFKTSCWYKD